MKDEIKAGVLYVVESKYEEGEVWSPVPSSVSPQRSTVENDLVWRCMGMNRFKKYLRLTKYVRKSVLKV